jgi:MtaA/CmuA family methyltransferase
VTNLIKMANADVSKKERFEDLVKTGTSKKPVLFQPILMHFAARFNQKTYAEFASDYKVLVESNIKAMDAFGIDMVGLISDPYRETSAFGAKIEYIKEGVPKCLNKIVTTIDDVKSLKNPDVYKEERTLDRIKGAELYRKKLMGKVPFFGWIEGPLAEACDLAGVSETLMNLCLDPDLSNFLLDTCTRTAKDFAKAQIDAGCDIIGIGDAICSQIDSETYNTFVKERHREIFEYIHQLGAKVKLHICGDINHLLPSIKDLPVDILDIDWKVGFSEAYAILGPHFILCGNINPVDIQDKNPESLKIITRELISCEAARPLILSGGCEITVNTPFENLMALRVASQ